MIENIVFLTKIIKLTLSFFFENNLQISIHYYKKLHIFFKFSTEIYEINFY